MERNGTKPFLNPNEMAFRKVYWPLLRDEKITTVFRPGKRLVPTMRSYHEGQLVMARIIENVGADWAGVAPEFVANQTKQIKIVAVTAKMIGAITKEDFVGSSPDIFDGYSLRYQLGVIYNLYPEELSDESFVTIIQFSYTPMQNERKEKELNTLSSLLESGILSFAKLPKDNPSQLGSGPYTITLIDHDYPGKTPTMWNAAYRKYGLSATNIMLVGNPDKAKEIIEVFKKDPRYLGGGAGVGFKDEVAKFIKLDGMAEAIGAINFIAKTSNGDLLGYNTDGRGYAVSLETMFSSPLSGSRVVLLGAGGTGNAVAFALADEEVDLIILNRTVDKARELAERINRYFRQEVAVFGGEDQIAKEVKCVDAVVNVSTKGAAGNMEAYSALAPAKLPATPENIATNLAEADAVLESIAMTTTILSDIVLTQNGTPFLNAAKKKGFRTLDGVPMVVNQGVEAFWLLHREELTKKGVSKEQLRAVMEEAANLK